MIPSTGRTAVQLVVRRDPDDRGDLARPPPFGHEPDTVALSEPDVDTIDVERLAHDDDGALHDAHEVERRVHHLGQFTPDALILRPLDLDDVQPCELAHQRVHRPADRLDLGRGPVQIDADAKVPRGHGGERGFEHLERFLHRRRAAPAEQQGEHHQREPDEHELDGEAGARRRRARDELDDDGGRGQGEQPDARDELETAGQRVRQAWCAGRGRTHRDFLVEHDPTLVPAASPPRDGSGSAGRGS